MAPKNTGEPIPASGAKLVKASAEPAVPPHPDRSFYEQKVGLLWAELRAIYKNFFGHAPKCKNCGHEL